ncbi:MAG: M1 family aminopeptidase, partial [Planctomycetota bacterium]
VIAFLWLQDYGQLLLNDMDNRFLACLIEPSGLSALDAAARYWTPGEYETALPEISGALLANRLAWLGMAALFLGLGYLSFSYTRAASGKRKRRRIADEEGKHEAPGSAWLEMPVVHRSFSAGTAVLRLLRCARLETAEIIRGTPFLVLVLFDAMFLVSFAWVVGQHRGAPAYPTTHWMLEALAVCAKMIVPAVVIFYSGELIWNDRIRKRDSVLDSLPVSDSIALGGKLLALIVIVSLFLIIGALSTTATQLVRGFHDIEPTLYLKGLFFLGYPFVLLSVLALLLQELSRNRYMGYLLILVVILVRRASPMLGFEHNLYRYGGLPQPVHSDMNGYGHYTEPFLWFGLYWGFGAIMLFVLTVLLRARGAERGWPARFSAARQRWRGTVKIVMAAAFTGFIATGCWIFYNTNILTEYSTRRSRIAQLAEYEKLYKKYEHALLPRITSVRADVDLFPDERRAEISGTYHLVNPYSEPIMEIPMTLSPKCVEGVLAVYSGVHLKSIDLPGHRVRLADDLLGFYLYELDTPLEPGGTLDLGFAVTVHHEGFSHRWVDDLVVANGTIFGNRNFFPLPGYASGSELLDPKERRRYGLPPVERMPLLDDDVARDTNYLWSVWVDFEVTLSTNADQIALAPGYLQREWIEGDRRYFHYKTEAPIVNLLCFISGKYEVAHDAWNGVSIDVYHHRSHAFNVDRLIHAAKISLDYYSSSFGPYPHRQIRIVEVPTYHGQTAWALAQTIPYSEAMGFTMKIREKDIDFVTFVTAHEVAHQWWNHQVVPAHMQGSTMVAEALAEYSALMVMEREYGSEHVRQLLKYELDNYLKGRSSEKVREMPLLKVENQMYIHYAKGCMAMYALKDCIGEEALNRALRRFLEANAFKGPPYTTSRELLRYIRQEVPDEFAYLLEDLFETITLFDNRTEEARCVAQDDGTFRVTIEITARKLRADGQGVEKEIPVNDWIDIGVFGEEKALFMEKRRIDKTR